MSQGIEDLKEEIQALQARVEELELEQVNPRWREVNVARQQATRGPSPYDPVTIKRMRDKRKCSCGCGYTYLPGECKYGDGP